MFRRTLLRHRHWFLSLAILAVLMNALAPGLSQAMQAGQQRLGGGWIEACSIAGSKWIKLDAAGQALELSFARPSDVPTGDHEASCGYCLPHAASFALLDAGELGSWHFQEPAGHRPAVDDSEVAIPQTWAHPAPRGPPRA